MATDEMGNMRECRPSDCAWAVYDGGSTACAVSLLAVTARAKFYREVSLPSFMREVRAKREETGYGA